MARADTTVSRGVYQADLRRAADFLYRAVLASGSVPSVESLPTPLSVRIGPHTDAFFALLFFLEVAGPGEAGAGRYGGAIDVLIRKIEKHQNPDGSWGHVWDAGVGHAGAAQAPMLGHAVGVWGAGVGGAARHQGRSGNDPPRHALRDEPGHRGARVADERAVDEVPPRASRTRAGSRRGGACRGGTRAPKTPRSTTSCT